MKTIAEQIVALEATRAELQKRMGDVFQKSVDEGRSMDTAESAEFDSAEMNVKTIDADLGRARRMEAIQGAGAQGVAALAEAKALLPSTTEPRSHSDVQLKTVETLEPGIAFARYAMCLGKAKGDHAKAFRLAEANYPKTENVVKLLKAQSEGANISEIMQTKATVAAGTTLDSTWAAPLVYANTFGGDFISYLRPRTLLGQAAFRPIPFNVRVAGQTSGGTAGWVGQGKAKPVTKFDYNALTTSYTKVAAIAVLTQELIRLSDPSAEALVRESLADCVIERIDSDLMDPDLAGVANVNPAGLLFGVAPVAGVASPYGQEEILCAIMRLWAPWDTSNIGARPAYYTTPAVARFLAFQKDALGNEAFPGMSPFGGTLNGIPVRVSQYLANNGGSGGAPFILVDEAEIYLADDGSVTLDASEQASVEMSNTPTGSSSATVAASSTNFVSMWQTNSVAFRAERFIWWGARRAGAVQWIDGFPTSC